MSVFRSSFFRSRDSASLEFAVLPGCLLAAELSANWFSSGILEQDVSRDKVRKVETTIDFEDLGSKGREYAGENIAVSFKESVSNIGVRQCYILRHRSKKY